MKHLVITLAVIISITFLNNCNTTEPPPPDDKKPELTLAIDDTSCTEAWLQLTTKDLELPAELTLKQYNPTGDSVTQTFSLSAADTLLYVDSLLPNQTYKFKAILKTTTNQLTVTTMDTTSHNFTFTSWTFGAIGSSVLYDVAIINENNIWAVGEIMIADTSQNGYTTYNAVHWDGSGWELKRIPFTYNGQTFYSAIKAILAFNENDIWFGIASLIHWNGMIYQSISTQGVFPASINKMWGTSTNDFYIVGTNGQIAHYNGSNWQKIESGTGLNIYDIWGDFNEKTQEWEILAVASNFGTSLEKEILQIKNNSVIKLPLSPQMWPLKTVWFISNRQYYVAGGGIYQKRLITDDLWRNNILDFTTFTTTSLRGNNVNDVIAVGAFGDFLHFNGIQWKNNYSEPLLGNGTYGQIEIKNNLLIAVGDNFNQAVVLMGIR